MLQSLAAGHVPASSRVSEFDLQALPQADFQPKQIRADYLNHQQDRIHQ